ncbi:hypothetical protein DFH06DRAFT_751024 [Mycena polygramma]|nr:hypothetical protein DFH06DRAFT_751024 [Mycena polygramma]
MSSESNVDLGVSSEAPTLPPELEQEIFETTAVRHRSAIPALLRVCHRVHAWVEPLLYRVLSPSSPDSILAAQTKSAEFLRRSVRHVFFEKGWRCTEWETPKDLLLKSSGTIDLYVQGDFDLEVIDILDHMRLQKLAFLADNVLWKPSFLQRPLFLYVTHLELFKPSLPLVAPVWQDWCHLGSLPALTHLSLSEPFHTQVLPGAIADCRLLSVAVLAFWAEYQHAEAAVLAENLAVNDPRVVVMVTVSYIADWEIGARGGDDLWIRAEQFISRKRRGEIKANCYFLNE